MTQIDEKLERCTYEGCGVRRKDHVVPTHAFLPPHHITVTIDTRTHKVVPLIPDEKMLLAGFSYADMIAAAPEHKEG